MDGLLSSLTEKFVKIEISTGDLRKLPAVHAGFFVSSCLAVTEINLFQKFLLLSHNTVSENRPIENKELKDIAFIQTVTIQRNLAAKILEYIKLLESYKKSNGRANDTSMNVFFDESTAEVLRLKEDDNYKLALWYRNKVTNHYISSELISLFKDEKLDHKDSQHYIYLHQMDGNSSYILGEQVLLTKLLETNSSPIDHYEQYADWVLDAAATITKLHSHFCIQLFDIHLPDKELREFEVVAEPHLVGELSKICLPILLNN